MIQLVPKLACYLVPALADLMRRSLGTNRVLQITARVKFMM